MIIDDLRTTEARSDEKDRPSFWSSWPVETDDVYSIVWGELFSVRKMLELSGILWLAAVAVLWGFSTPLLRRGSEGLENVGGRTAIQKWFNEVCFLARKPKFVIPFLMNQSGSAIYALSLGSNDLSLAVPLANSMTFVCTTLAGALCGEKVNDNITYIGISMVIIGVMICIADKAWT